MTKYGAEHSSAFQDVKDAGAEVSFKKKTTTVSGVALQVKPSLPTYVRHGARKELE